MEESNDVSLVENFDLVRNEEEEEESSEDRPNSSETEMDLNSFTL